MTALFIIVISFLIYFLPTIVAYQRKTGHWASIFLFNMFLGWTGLGWFIAMLMAYSHHHSKYSQD
jgi:hypothetical protein